MKLVDGWMKVCPEGAARAKVMLSPKSKKFILFTTSLRHFKTLKTELVRLYIQMWLNLLFQIYMFVCSGPNQRMR